MGRKHHLCGINPSFLDTTHPDGLNIESTACLAVLIHKRLSFYFLCDLLIISGMTEGVLEKVWTHRVCEK